MNKTPQPMHHQRDNSEDIIDAEFEEIANTAAPSTPARSIKNMRASHKFALSLALIYLLWIFVSLFGRLPSTNSNYTPAIAKTASDMPKIDLPTPAPAIVKKSVIIYTGEVNEENAASFLSMISDNVDNVIGLKVLFHPPRDEINNNSGYLAGYSEGQLVITLSDPSGEEAGFEMVYNGPVDRLMGGYAIDGVFIPKAGGFHQGTASFGLESVDEASIRLDPAINLVERAF